MRYVVPGLVVSVMACSQTPTGGETGETGGSSESDTSGASESGDEESGSETAGDGDGDAETGDGDGAAGSFTVLAYNVAGLPEPLSSGQPVDDTPLISPLLNLYDLALVQEDFAYHDLLEADAEHPFQSIPAMATLPDLGDGLNRFSWVEFSTLQRAQWVECSGLVGGANDCLTAKGFSFARHTLAPGLTVDVYNLHMDAGGGAGDIAARDAQVTQLSAFVSVQSAGQAVVIAGDTNMGSDDESQVQALLTGTEVQDVCRALGCPEPSRIDRIMFRSSATVTLTPTEWIVDGRFVDGNGDPLSDHEAVGATFEWSG
jgi:hypothetical protein